MSVKKNQNPTQDQLELIINFYTRCQFQKSLLESNKMLKIYPYSIDLYNICGASNAALNNLDAALDNYKKAIALKPNSAEAYNNIGIVFKDQGKLDESLEVLKKAIALKPNYAEAYNNTGVVFMDQGKLDKSLEVLKKAIALKPNYAEAYNNIGLSFYFSGENDLAINSFKEAIKIKLNFSEAYNNMGLAFFSKGDLEESIDSYKNAINFKSDFAEAYNNMGDALSEKGELYLSIESFKQALKFKPCYDKATANKLYQQANICDWEEIEKDKNLICKIGISNEGISPFSLISLEDEPEIQRVRSENFIKSHFKQKPLKIRPRPILKPKRLRIGYFSSDFYNHATMYLMAKVFEMHNKNDFEIFAYSFGPVQNDKMRIRLKNTVDFFYDVKDIGDRDVALLAQKNKLDIAIDLKGYTKNSRSGIFAYGAAPIQISYLGYPGTTGASYIHYIIADQVIIPKQNQPFFSESIIYLPNSYQANDNSRKISDATISRSEAGLPKQGFVFCSFNSNYKISSIEFNIWMSLLSKVDGSVLWLLKTNNWAEVNLKKEAEKKGIDSDRLIFAKKLPQDLHLSRHNLADIFLDTFNCNAHTTASDALWMGLPVVTKMGKGFPSRVAGSLLNAIGLPELVTQTVEDYEALALKLANDPSHLKSVKQKIIENRFSEPLFDTELFTSHLESGFRQAYKNYFDGRSPETIYISK
jgi:predicted O-linked N-acetylglucosamine transferase (SPINDLY family)